MNNKEKQLCYAPSRTSMIDTWEPSGHTYKPEDDMTKEEIDIMNEPGLTKLAAAQFKHANKWLDDRNVPRFEGEHELSLVGRIMAYKDHDNL